jgi:hypothetical protein
LSFDHFKTARRLYKDGFTPYVNYALEWCVEGNDDKLAAGRFHTVGDMMHQFIPELRDANPLELMWSKVKERMYDQFLLIENDTYREELLELWRETDLTIGKVCDNIKVEV